VGCDDAVSNFTHNIVCRMRTQIGTITHGRFRGRRLVVSEMITEPECLPGIRIRQNGKRSGRRNCLACGGGERGVPGRLNRAQIPHRSVSVDQEFDDGAGPLPIRGLLQVHSLRIPLISHPREDSEGVVSELHRAALAQHLKATDVRHALAYDLGEPAATEPSGG